MAWVSVQMELYWLLIQQIIACRFSISSLWLQCAVLQNAVLVFVVARFEVPPLQMFRPDGCWLRSFGSFGAELGQLKYPNAVAADESGRIVVSDNWNHRVQVIPLCPVDCVELRQ